MTDQARRRPEREKKEKERKEVCYARGRGRGGSEKERGREEREELEEEGGGQTERWNVDSIHRAQVEMVAHKYSYGIPEARKTSIPAEAHVCPLLLVPRLPPRVHSVILRPANGKTPW